MRQAPSSMVYGCSIGWRCGLARTSPSAPNSWCTGVYAIWEVWVSLHAGMKHRIPLRDVHDLISISCEFRLFCGQNSRSETGRSYTRTSRCNRQHATARRPSIKKFGTSRSWRSVVDCFCSLSDLWLGNMVFLFRARAATGNLTGAAKTLECDLNGASPSLILVEVQTRWRLIRYLNSFFCFLFFVFARPQISALPPSVTEMVGADTCINVA